MRSMAISLNENFIRSDAFTLHLVTTNFKSEQQQVSSVSVDTTSSAMVK
jgi:hypothetical protein